MIILISGTGSFNNPYNLGYNDDPYIKSILLLNKKCKLTIFKNLIKFCRAKAKAPYVPRKFRLPLKTSKFLQFNWLDLEGLKHTPRTHRFR